VTDDEKFADEIYEASVVPELWPQLLDRLAQEVDAALGSIFIIGKDGALRWTGTERANELFEAFLAHQPQIEPVRLQKAAEIEIDGFYTDLDFNDPSIFRHPAYTDFLYPRNFGWHAATKFELPTGDKAFVGFERYRDRGTFEPSYVERLNRLRPHLGRAAVMSAQLGLERARGMTQALDTVGIPAAVLRSTGTMFIANEQFHKLMPAIVQDRRERIRLSDTNADVLLANALAQFGPKHDSGPSRSIPVAAKENTPPLIFHLVPVKGAARDIFSRGIALLIGTPIDRAAVPTAEVLQGLFDLTPAEARVARGVAQGKTLEAIAIQYGISRETVRTQLASVLAKTGMSRQAELVALLAGKAFG
jgi:DNA-binding CsgD family transcriptional regulator